MSEPHYPYDDGFRQNRIDDGIRRGLIIKHIDHDGIVRYEITQLGMMQYAAECLTTKMQRDFAAVFRFRQ